MFTTLGLFADTPCPQGHECTLLTCLFSHKSRNFAPKKHVPHAAKASEDDSVHVAKKLKVESDAPSSVQSLEASQRQPLSEVTTSTSTTAPPDLAKQSGNPEQAAPKLLSTTRPVSPPPSTRAGAKSAGQESSVASAAAAPQPLPPRKVPKESLNPRMLPKAPATHAVRSAILTKLHTAIVNLNERLSKDEDSSNKCFVLSRDELVTMALDEEEKVARESPGVYSNVIKLRIVKLMKMDLEEWAKEVMAHLNARYYKIKPVEPTQRAPKPITTGLPAQQEVALVTRLVTPLKGLEEFGYVTKLPTESEIKTAEKGVVESKGWEKCDRCGGRFQVFPGRREDGSLTSGGQCTYHPARPIYPARKKTDRVSHASESYFPCCGESLGTSSGCTKSNTHVFKVSETKRLASILQFKQTPTQPDKDHLEPVCLDCEMGYTTLGLELIRLTAVSWPEGRDLLDVLVKPMGEILDLNSRYSGIFPENYASARPYGSSEAAEDPTVQEVSGKRQSPLQVVESPAAARELLFQLLQPETPLIGHAIDNDLNVCRIIHPTVIDTVLLYPHPIGRLPHRMSLRTLARKFLDRDIQTGGDRGHDSREDSIATGDLVRVKAGELWTRLKAKGWKFEGDALIPPPGQVASDIHAVAMNLGAGLGQKRKNPGMP